MLNSGKKFALCATKKINILTRVLSEKKILNETKNHNPPPLQVKWSVPKLTKLSAFGFSSTNSIKVVSETSSSPKPSSSNKGAST